MLTAVGFGFLWVFFVLKFSFGLRLYIHNHLNTFKKLNIIILKYRYDSCHMNMRYICIVCDCSLYKCSYFHTLKELLQMGSTISPFLCHKQGFLVQNSCLFTSQNLPDHELLQQNKTNEKHIAVLIIFTSYSSSQISPMLLVTVHNVTREDAELFINNSNH